MSKLLALFYVFLIFVLPIGIFAGLVGALVHHFVQGHKKENIIVCCTIGAIALISVIVLKLLV